MAVPVIDFSEFVGSFARVDEGINTIGGVIGHRQPDGSVQRVFVKFMPKYYCCAAAFADEAFSRVFGLPSVGMRVVRIIMPHYGGGEMVPRFRYQPGDPRGPSEARRGGFQWALMAPFLEFPTIHAHILRTEGIQVESLRRNKDVSMVALRAAPPERYRSMLTAWARAIAVRTAFGAGDAGPSNFLWDAANERIYSLDLGGAFSASMNPSTGEPRKLLESNLLPDAAKTALLSVDADSVIHEFCRTLDERYVHVRNELVRLIEQYPCLSRKAANQVDRYLMPNITTMRGDFAALLRSQSARSAPKKKRSASAADGEEEVDARKEQRASDDE